MLHTPEQQQIDHFVDGIKSGFGPRGLWVHGPRQSGTTTYARRVAEAVYSAGCYDLDMSEGCLITATALSDLQRKVWTQEDLMRSNSHDMALWQETQALVSRWEDVWDANVLMIDDLISVDTEFWKKHLLARIDQRLKGKGVTLLAGVIAPSWFGPDWGTGFSRLCTVIRLRGEHGEG